MKVTKKTHAARILDRAKKVMKFQYDIELARQLGVTDGAVSQWRSTGKMPMLRILQIERETGGVIAWKGAIPLHHHSRQSA